MSKADVLAKLVSTGGPLANGAITVSDISGLQTTLDDKLALSGGTLTGNLIFNGTQTWPTFNQNTTGNAATATTAINVSGGTANVTSLTTSSTVTLNGGTASGVSYLNGSKVLTTGSALTFDGTTLATTGKFGITGNGSVPTSSALEIGTNGAGSRLLYNVPTSGEHNFTVNGLVVSFQTASAHGWSASGSEQMRLTSTGLGIGTSSPNLASWEKALTISAGTTGDSKAILELQGTRTANDGAVSAVRTFIGSKAVASINIHRGSVGDEGSFVFYTAPTSGSITERARIDSSGNFLVGTTSSSPNPGLFVSASGAMAIGNNAQASGWGFINFLRSGTSIGSISQNGTAAVLYSTSSDYRLKNTIAPMTDALAKVSALKPVTYKWNSDGSSGQGFIAHELAEVVPDAVTGEKDAVDTDGNPIYQGIDTSFLIATLTAAIQEQQIIIKSLTDRITTLESN
jgi:hypothetical protein